MPMKKKTSLFAKWKNKKRCRPGLPRKLVNG